MRYTRQEIVIGKRSQEKLAKSSVAIIGLGAIGSLTSELLCRSGVGHMLLVDRDIVELSNLQRQTIYDESDCGLPKAQAAQKHLRQINSGINILSGVADVNFRNIEMLKQYDLILDCTDNLYTRFLLNEFCRKNRIPWIYAGAIKEQGNVMSVLPDQPCFRCTFEEAEGIDTCETAGIMNMVSAAVSSIQAYEAVQLLTGKKVAKSQSLIHLDLRTYSIRLIRTRKNKDCPVCHASYGYLSGNKEPRIIKYGCSGTYVLFRDSLDFDAVKKNLSRLGKVQIADDCLFFDGLSIFRTGKIIVKGESEKDARAKISRFIGM